MYDGGRYVHSEETWAYLNGLFLNTAVSLTYGKKNFVSWKAGKLENCQLESSQLDSHYCHM